MKILLMSLNSKFIHTNLAIQYIKQFYEIKHRDSLLSLTVKEYTINNDMDVILRDISKGEYTHIFASAYIWNVEHMDIIFLNLKQINPSVKIIYGGPEVAYNPIEQLKNTSFLDAVIFGEGEKIFSDLIENIQLYGNVDGLNRTRGIAYKNGSEIIQNKPMPLIEPLDLIPFPYNDLTDFENRILYYESSRGCPYNCSYCLSSASNGVRHLSFERVKQDLDFFLEHKVAQVKFVDRTFNTSRAHALEIFRYLIEKDNGKTNFHFEITATLLDETYFNVLKNARPGLFQFEVGIQTTHEPTMHAIHRPMSFSLLKKQCQMILDMKNIHLHVDLIAGLPYETFNRFLTSFDDVYEIGADQLQLGFLKVLKGTVISKEVELHGFKVRTNAPFEVLSNNYITFDEMCRLKEIESLLEYFSNSGKFKHSLPYFIKRLNVKPSVFFLDFALYFSKKDYFSSPVGTYRLYEILYDYYVETFEESNLFKDLLKVDYYFANLKGQRALFHYEEMPNFNAKRVELLGNESFQKQVLNLEERMTAKQILRNVEFITLKYDIMALIQSEYERVIEKANVIMFDYTNRESTKMISISFEGDQ